MSAVHDVPASIKDLINKNKHETANFLILGLIGIVMVATAVGDIMSYDLLPVFIIRLSMIVIGTGMMVHGFSNFVMCFLYHFQLLAYRYWKEVVPPGSENNG